MPQHGSTLSVIGHTRFATSSKNIESELHPHEFATWKMEHVWQFNHRSGEFEKHEREVGLHLTHNGDFDGLTAYDQVIIVDDVGRWLERILHTKNDTHGDSPKVCGMMDLLRVQGRWAAAARLAWVRVVLKEPNNVSGGQPLSKSAPNTFPDGFYWAKWEVFFENIFLQHKNNIIKVQGGSTYSVDRGGLSAFIGKCVELLADAAEDLNIVSWVAGEKASFVSSAVKGFLRADLYTALTELLSRAEGSFGLQVHSTLEEGVVVIASKGQPMSISFSEDLPIVLFGSEAEVLLLRTFFIRFPDT